MGTKDSMWAKHHMTSENNQYRPEQITLYKQLRTTRTNSELVLEYTIYYKNEGGMNKCAVVDIVDLTRRECFRLNGDIHYSSNVRWLKDEEQRLYLEELGWKVTDIDTRP